MWRREWFFCMEDRTGILHGKIFGGISVRPLGAKTAIGREAGGDALTLVCPFWVKHRKGQEEKVFPVPFLYMRPPSSHTLALLYVPSVNEPFESEIHGTVNLTTFCCVLLLTWCHRVLFSRYLRPK